MFVAWSALFSRWTMFYVNWIAGCTRNETTWTRRSLVFSKTRIQSKCWKYNTESNSSWIPNLSTVEGDVCVCVLRASGGRVSECVRQMWVQISLERRVETQNHANPVSCMCVYSVCASEDWLKIISRERNRTFHEFYHTHTYVRTKTRT